MTDTERDTMERLIATLENVLLHHQQNMPEGDRESRWDLVHYANRLLNGGGGA